MEGVTLLAVMIFMMAMLVFLRDEIERGYLLSQASEVSEIDVAADQVIHESFDRFKAFADTGARSESALMLKNFSDIYYCSDSAVITRIIRKSRDSMIFEGFDLSGSRVAEFLANNAGLTHPHSTILRAPENNRFSVYVSARSISGRIVGRIDIDILSEYLKRTANYTQSIIVLSSRDGFVMTSTSDRLPLHVLGEQTAGEIELSGIPHLFTRKYSPVLGVDIILFTPLTRVLSLLGPVEKFFYIFLAVLILIILVKITFQSLKIIRPLGSFSAMLREWNLDTEKSHLSKGFLSYEEIAALYKSFSEGSQKINDAVAALRESEEKFRSMLSAIADYVFVMDGEHRFVFYHAPEGAPLMSPPEEFMGRKFSEVLPPDMAGKIAGVFALNTQGRPGDFDYYLDSGGVVRWYSAKMSPIMINDRFTGSIAVIRDITGLKESEQRALRDLEEKEVLLKEIHHRVKNNLNVITSLLSLQGEQIKNREQAVEAFRESSNRVFSMALVHERLYRSRDFSSIDFRDYIETMTRELISLNNVSKKINVDFDLESVPLDVNRAIPCGLILNELISNSIKHAFPDREEGTIRFYLRRRNDGMMELAYGDDGKGLPEGFDIRMSESLGLKLVTLLTRQIRGGIDIEKGTGTVFRIVFPAQEDA